MSQPKPETVPCPACGVRGLVCQEMVRHVKRCVAGVRLGGHRGGTLREAWERWLNLGDKRA